MGSYSEAREPLECPGEIFLRLMGLWERQDSALRTLSTARRCLTLLSLAFVVASAAAKLCMDTPQRLEELAHCSFVAVICSVLWIRTVLFIVYGTTLRQLVLLLIDTRGQHNQGEGNDCIRRRYETHVQRVSLIFQTATVSAVLYWLSSPLVSRALLGSDSSSRQLPLPVWVPVDAYASPTYEILYAAQCIGLTVAGACASCIDIFFIYFMQVIGAEFEVLCDNISAIQMNYDPDAITKFEGGIYKRQISEKTSAADIYTEVASHSQTHWQLARNIQHHQLLLRSLSVLQSAMSVPLFILLTINMANLCANVFIAVLLLQRDGNVSKALIGLVAIPPVLIQTGMYCVYGHVLTDQSEKLVHSAFSCGWTDCDVRFRRSLLIFMTVAFRPVEITVGKMTKLSKQTLLQVLNGTYVLLNMLYHIQSNM